MTKDDLREKFQIELDKLTVRARNVLEDQGLFLFDFFYDQYFIQQSKINFIRCRNCGAKTKIELDQFIQAMCKKKEIEQPIYLCNISPTGEDQAVKVGEKVKIPSQPKKAREGLLVMFSNDPNNPNSPTFKEYDDPVSDRDLTSKGIIWINAVHPIIVKFDNAKSNEAVRNENIANFVLMIVAQYYAQKESELQPEDERDDQLLLFRKYFFKLQMDIRNDQEISYYE